MSLLGGIRLLFEDEDFKKTVEHAVTSYKAAGKKAVTTVTAQATAKLRSETTDAGLGKLSKAWKSKVYPTGEALNPAGFIYVAGERSVGALRAYSEGGTIRPKNGHKYLAIALPAAGKRATPEKLASRGVKLDFVPARGRRPAMLVAAGNVGETNKFRKATQGQQTTGKHATIFMFILIPLASIKARFSIEGTLNPFGATLGAEFARLVAAVSKD